jgi:superfamily I DNA and RNA helicase
LAYAITIYKSQGLEFPVVVTPLATQQYMLLQRNLVYTGITRGKKLVVLIGQRKALAMAVSIGKAARTGKERLRFEVSPSSSESRLCSVSCHAGLQLMRREGKKEATRSS